MRRWRAASRSLTLRALGASAAIVGLAACGACSRLGPERPRRIILFIGDGTGTAQWTAGLLSSGSLAVADFGTVGLVETGSASGPVTDSGASATALASGVRTFNRAIGVGPDSLSHPSVFEIAARQGLGRGVAVTSSVVHATPAAFYAHVPDRYRYDEIAAQAVDARLEVMLGGGHQYFQSTRRPDGRDLLAALRDAGGYVEDAAELAATDPDTLSRLVGLFAADGMAPAPERKPTLSEMTAKALAVLDHDPDGFVLMVEGSQIDWRSHDNAPFEEVAAEVDDFDRAIRVATAYAEGRPATLILVTADHETGGLAISWRDGRPVALYAHGSHSAELVPLFATGPGAERFSGVRSNDEIGRLLIELIDVDRRTN